MTSALNTGILKAAQDALENAYAPYSNFPVGAAILGQNGRIYVGCNVENAAYPQGLCAEAGAIAAMVADGEKRIEQICIVSGSAKPVPPCGGCRQKISEFSSPTTPIFVASANGSYKEFSMAELFPLPFGSKNLQAPS